MDFSRLKGFFTVVRSGGFTQAAKRLYLTQPTVSQQIKTLEDELGVKLFRRARPVTLTREGEILYELAENVFSEVDRIYEVFANLKKESPAVLNIAANQSTSMHVLPKKLEYFTQRFPSVEIAIHNMRTLEIIESVISGEINVGMVLVDPERTEISSRPVIPYEMVLITPEDHRLAAKRQITLEDIAKYPFISYTKTTDTRKLIDEPFRKAHQKTKIKMALGNTDLIITYVALGYGIAIVHNMNLAKNRPEGLAVRSLKRYFDPRNLHLIWKTGGETEFPTREFVSLF